MREIQTIDINRYEGQKSIGTKTGYEVFDLLKSHLESVGLLPDEYFSPSYYSEMENPLPEYSEAVCHTNWGGSEGIYIDITLKYYDTRTPKEMHFATGKTLGASGDDFIRMSRIAAECSMMLNGFGSIVRISKQERQEPKIEQATFPDYRSVTVLVCTHEHKHGIDTHVTLHPNTESAIEYADSERDNWFEVNKVGQDYFDFDFFEQTVDVSKFAPKQVCEEHHVDFDNNNNSRVYEIYQLKDSPESQQMLFMNYDWLTRHKQSIDISKYNLVYSGSMEPNETLDDIYMRFNIDHPEDFKGHSLSTSDVVAIRENGAVSAHFVDSIGFKKLPDFFEVRQRAQGLDEQIRTAAEKSAASFQANISDPER